MNIKLVEVTAEKNVAHKGVTTAKQAFSLRTVYINPEHVVCMRVDETMKRRQQDGLLSEDLDPRQEFTKLYINRGHSGLDITVVGAPDIIQKKFDEAKIHQKKLLKG